MAGYPRVTHPSATKSYFTRFPYDSVRLACVKHAASVHPEPGSNSHVVISPCAPLLPMRYRHQYTASLRFELPLHLHFVHPASFFWLILILLLGLFCSLKICRSLVCSGFFSLLQAYAARHPSLLWNLWGLSPLWFHWNLQGCITVYLSRYNTKWKIQLWAFCSSKTYKTCFHVANFSGNSDTIPYPNHLVNNFF